MPRRIPPVTLNLRTRLAISHVMVIALCLAISGAVFVFLLRGYREELAKGRLSDLASPVMFQVRAYERSGVTPQQLTSALQVQGQQLHARIIVLDHSSTVVADTDGRLTGKVLSLQRTSETDGRHPVATGEITDRGGSYYFVAVPMPAGKPPFYNERPSAYSEVIVATQQSSIVDAWRELLPSLLVAGLASLALSVLASLGLSRSIAGPVIQITRATEAMARGQVNQAIPVRQRDEIGRLAVAFNEMATQVHASQRLLRDFVANVSHELRTPLTSVQGFAQAIADGTAKTPEDVTLAASIIVEESERMHRLVDDLLYLSKLESGQLPIERAPVHLTDLVSLAVARVARRAEEAGVRLVTDVPPLPTVEIDGNRIEQVLANLLNNALQHTPSGGTITIGARAEPAATQGRSREATVVIEVHNTGSYIPEEERARIFERFYQVDRSRKREGGGAGLGLAISWEIVAAHGGSMTVLSDEATGTTFRVALPLGTQPAAPASKRRRLDAARVGRSLVRKRAAPAGPPAHRAEPAPSQRT